MSKWKNEASYRIMTMVCSCMFIKHERHVYLCMRHICIDNHQIIEIIYFCILPLRIWDVGRVISIGSLLYRLDFICHTYFNVSFFQENLLTLKSRFEYLWNNYGNWKLHVYFQLTCLSPCTSIMQCYLDRIIRRWLHKLK